MGIVIWNGYLGGGRLFWKLVFRFILRGNEARGYVLEATCWCVLTSILVGLHAFYGYL